VKIHIGWLRDYVDLNETTDEIADRLALLGFPVESIERRPQLSGVVAGRLSAVERHPNADRLQVCTVEAGPNKTLTIATAATNVAPGQSVPVALIGAKLVGLEIAPRKMRGIDSEGMLVSAGEVGLSQEWFEDGILQLEAGITPGTDLVELYRLNDDVIEIEVTANRVDAMSVIGVARELAAALGRTVRDPLSFDPVRTLDPSDGSVADLRVSIENADCRRYVARRLHGPGPRPSPMWLRTRLALCGQRPINDLVDVTNYVMFECGQPLHAFDYAALDGARIIARDARPGETLKTLDGAVHTLDPRVLVIADEDRASSIAGVIGGALSEVTDSTRELVLESANFVPARVRRNARAIGTRTEASSRHERALSIALADAASKRAADLYSAIGWTSGDPFAIGSTYETPAPIRTGEAEIEARLGMTLAPGVTERALTALGFKVETSDGSLLVTPPPWRTDVSIPADIAEEAGRIAGYDCVPSIVPPIVDQAVSSAAYQRENAVAERLASLGYREAITLSLQPASIRERYLSAGLDAPEAFEVANPLSEDQHWLRFSLLPGLLSIAARARGDAPLRIFEVGHVFERREGLPFERSMGAFVLVRPEAQEAPWSDAGFLEAKGDAGALLRMLCGREADAQRAGQYELHPGKCAVLRIGDEEALIVGALNPKLAAAFEIEGRAYAGLIDLDRLPPYQLPQYRAPSRFPAVERDLSIVVAPDVFARDIASAVRTGASSALRDVTVFDEYRGPQIGDDKKSVTVRIQLGLDDATMTDRDAGEHMARILESLRSIGASIRE
jgi:phenylalanyl-tRNA synthetase beta chain